MTYKMFSEEKLSQVGEKKQQQSIGIIFFYPSKSYGLEYEKATSINYLLKCSKNKAAKVCSYRMHLNFKMSATYKTISLHAGQLCLSWSRFRRTYLDLLPDIVRCPVLILRFEIYVCITQFWGILYFNKLCFSRLTEIGSSQEPEAQMERCLPFKVSKWSDTY